CLGRGVTPKDVPGRAPVGIDEPLSGDPRADLPPPACAQAPQPTRLHPPSKGAKEREAPSFKLIGTPQFTTGTGKLTTNFDSENKKNTDNHLITRPDQGVIAATANVQLVGNPNVFADYEVGFIQSVISDETEVEYDSGHHVIQQLPT